jgi:hypothetical protein
MRSESGASLVKRTLPSFDRSIAAAAFAASRSNSPPSRPAASANTRATPTSTSGRRVAGASSPSPTGLTFPSQGRRDPVEFGASLVVGAAGSSAAQWSPPPPTPPPGPSRPSPGPSSGKSESRSGGRVFTMRLDRARVFTMRLDQARVFTMRLDRARVDQARVRIVRELCH